VEQNKKKKKGKKKEKLERKEKHKKKKRKFEHSNVIAANGTWSFVTKWLTKTRVSLYFIYLVLLALLYLPVVVFLYSERNVFL